MLPSPAPGTSVKQLLPWLVAVGFFMESLDTTILSTAVPAIADAFAFGFFSSLQYTGMNTLAYADITEEQTSSASSIASTMQQMSVSFGVAAASLATAFFIPDRFHHDAPEMIRGIHQAFLCLGGLTVLSTIVFCELKNDDGDNVSQHHGIHHVG